MHRKTISKRNFSSFSGDGRQTTAVMAEEDPPVRTPYVLVALGCCTPSTVQPTFRPGELVSNIWLHRKMFSYATKGHETAHTFRILQGLKEHPAYRLLLEEVIITSPAGAHVCVCVCLSLCLSVCLSACLFDSEPHARSLPNLLCMLPMAVARSFSGGMTQSQGEGSILGLLPH